MDKHRLDKWLWAARFYKTRSAAADDVGKGRVSVNGQPAKASRELREGDLIEMRLDGLTRAVSVRALTRQRGPASVAQALYEETAASVERRAALTEARRSQPDPALAIEAGRPTKRDRRELAQWHRWSASIDHD